MTPTFHVTAHQAELDRIVGDVLNVMFAATSTPAGAPPGSDSYTSTVGFVGDWRGALLVRCGTATARRLAQRLDLIPADTWAFCWQVRPPLFEWSEEEGKWVSVHHPFTSPVDDDDLDPATAKARAYDLVLNGFELGGGSIRIHRPEVQRRVFEVLGLTSEEIDEKFGHLLTAFRYGVPPHGGVAFGIDRLVMLMAGKEAIRDVTAFPKAQSGADPLTGAPAPVDDQQLRDLGIRLVAPPTKEVP